MKLLKTIEKLIKESEEAYVKACETFTNEEELVRLEKNYKDSLKLLRTYKSIQKGKPKT